jgi:single-strand DNA-binding protein
MGNVNKVMLLGNLGADPELKKTPVNQRSYCHLRIATHHSSPKDANGERQERTEWHRVTVWGENAESCARFLTKGRSVFVEGRLETRSWSDSDGKKHYATDVVATRVVFLGGGAAQNNNADKAA